MRKTVINDKNIYVMYATMRMRSKRREKENKKNAQRSTKKKKRGPTLHNQYMDCFRYLKRFSYKMILSNMSYISNQ